MAKFVIDPVANITISINEISNDKFCDLYSVIIENNFYNDTVRFGLNKNKLCQLIDFLNLYRQAILENK